MKIVRTGTNLVLPMFDVVADCRLNSRVVDLERRW